MSHQNNITINDNIKTHSVHGSVTSFSSKSQFKTAQQAQKQARLKHLLDQASVYSKFLSSKFIKAQTADAAEITGMAQHSRTLVTQPALITGGSLKQYQLEGLEWLVSLYENGLNGILADEMGLGKTLQCIAFLAFLREKGVYGPFLIAAPLSTLANWKAELKRFAPEIPSLVYHGTKNERAELRHQHFGSGAVGRSKKVSPDTFPIIITSYEIIMNDKVHLDAFKWKFIIVDEGHRIKNLNCKLIKTLKEFDSANRLLLTGTPLQNNLSELWSLLNFLLPDIFDDLEVFQRWFDVSEIIDDDSSVSSNTEDSIAEQHRLSIVSNLHSILRPFLLRRLKVDVETDLPPKKEYLISCQMSGLQLQYYHAALTRQLASFVESQIRECLEEQEKTKKRKGPVSKETAKKTSTLKKLRRVSKQDDSIEEDELEDDEFLQQLEAEADFSFEPEADDARFLSENSQSLASKELRQVKLQNLFMQLRKVCNHPFLFFHPYDAQSQLMRVDELLVSQSGKMIILDQLLGALLKRHHRTLIFSQMTGMLDILEQFLEMRGIKYCRIDGSTSQPEREEQLALFRAKNSKIPVFLLSTRAAGLGINLVAADTVIFYDSDWNPQMDLQAQDRVHRIGQERPVLIYRLVTADSVESKILERASSKRKLEKVVIHKGKRLP